MDIEVELGPKLEVNANITDEKKPESGAGSHKLLIGSTIEQHAVADVVVEHRTESHVNGEETTDGVDTLDKPTINGETMEVTNGAVNGEGETLAAEVSPSSNPAASGESSPGLDGTPENKDSKIISKSQNSIEQNNGETGSVGSGKSPSKKKGFLSGGLHIRIPKLQLGSRGSISSDISATSTASGSEVDGSPSKKKRKKAKKNKKTVNTDEDGSGVKKQATPDPSECSENVTNINERVEDNSRELDDMDQSVSPGKAEEQETVSSPSDAPSPHLASNGQDITEDVIVNTESVQKQTEDGSQDTIGNGRVAPGEQDSSQLQTIGIKSFLLLLNELNELDNMIMIMHPVTVLVLLLVLILLVSLILS